MRPTELIGKCKGGAKERNMYRHLEIMFDFLHYRDLGFMYAVAVSAPSLLLCKGAYLYHSADNFGANPHNQWKFGCETV